MEDKTVLTCSFSAALRMLKAGKRVTRMGWNGPSQYIEMQVPDDFSKMSLPYIYICTVTGDLVPWLASQTDLLMEDWAEVVVNEDQAELPIG